MHKSIIEFSMKENVEAGFHTAVMDQIPEDRDVFHVVNKETFGAAVDCYETFRLSHKNQTKKFATS